MAGKPPRDDIDPFASSKERAGWSGTAQPVPPAPPLPPGSPGAAVPPPPLAYPSANPPPGGYVSPPSPPGTWGASNGKNWMGIVSLILGLTCFASGIIGAIFGHLGLSACARGEANNRGIALAGVIVNYVMLALGLVGLAITVAADSDSPSSIPTHSSGFATQGTDSPETVATDDLATHPLDPAQTKASYWYDLTIGDCITSMYAEEQPVEGEYLFVDPTVLPCDEVHYGEVYAIAGIGGFEPPSDATFEAHRQQLCEGRAFEEYVGVSDYYESSIYYDVLYPNDSAWKDGGREMVCVLYEEDETTLGTLRGSGL